MLYLAVHRFPMAEEELEYIVYCLIGLPRALTSLVTKGKGVEPSFSVGISASGASGSMPTSGGISAFSSPLAE